MAVSFKAQAVKSVSVGKVEFKGILGQHLVDSQDTFKEKLIEEGYGSDMAEKIVDAILTQVFGFLTGPNASEKTE